MHAPVTICRYKVLAAANARHQCYPAALQPSGVLLQTIQQLWIGVEEFPLSCAPKEAGSNKGCCHGSLQGESNADLCSTADSAVMFTAVGASQLFCCLQQCNCVSPPPCRQHITGQSVMHMRPTPKVTTGSLGPAHCCIVQRVFTFVNPLRMLRKQPQYASNDTALARVGNADAAALVANPAAANTFTALQQATT